MKSLRPTRHQLDVQARQMLERISSMTPFKRRCVFRKHHKTTHPEQGTFLYKFRPIKNGDTVDTVLTQRVREILVESKLFLPSPASFNDPFDMTARMEFVGKPQEKRKRMEQMVRRQEPSLGKRSREALISDLMARDDIGSADLLQWSHDVGREQSGVYCFAGDPRNVLMWSHYADRHKGICIQFDRSQDVELSFGTIPVDYEKESVLPTLNWTTDDAKENLKSARTKAKIWSYEKECRLIKPEFARSTIDINPRAVTGVILGCRIDAEAREIIRSLLDERRRNRLPDCVVWQAQMITGKPELRIVCAR